MHCRSQLDHAPWRPSFEDPGRRLYRVGDGGGGSLGGMQRPAGETLHVLRPGRHACMGTHMRLMHWAPIVLFS